MPSAFTNNSNPLDHFRDQHPCSDPLHAIPASGFDGNDNDLQAAAVEVGLTSSVVTPSEVARETGYSPTNPVNDQSTDRDLAVASGAVAENVPYTDDNNLPAGHGTTRTSVNRSLADTIDVDEKMSEPGTFVLAEDERLNGRGVPNLLLSGASVGDPPREVAGERGTDIGEDATRGLSTSAPYINDADEPDSVAEHARSATAIGYDTDKAEPSHLSGDLPRGTTSEDEPIVGSSSEGPPGTDQPDGTLSDPFLLVEGHLLSSKLEFGPDGTLRHSFAAATTLAEIAEFGAISPPNINDLVDDMILAGIPYKPSVLKMAIRVIGRLHATARKRELITQINVPLASHEDHHLAMAALMRFVEKVFEGDPKVMCLILLHFIYQVKRKLARLAVSDHLMPIFVSAGQGVGKTRALERFLAPVWEIAKSVRLTDIADTRSIFVFRHPVLIVDDMEGIQRHQVATLKNRITGDTVTGRGMQTNHDVGIEQRATFIGTSNESISDAVPDPSGHRRFYEMPFRNGNPADAGDPEIWKVVSTTDFLPIWRSVDPFAPSPIEAVRDQVFGKAGPRPPKSKVHAWALALDIESDAVRQILEVPGVQSQLLCDLYCEQCQDAWMKPEVFGRLMKEACVDVNVPFDWPRRRAKGVYYPLRKRPR